MKNITSTLKLAAAIAAVTGLVSQTNASAQQVQVTITSNAPTGGVALTPVWVGFHDGSFDSYNGGLSSQPGLERLAEDGNFGDASTLGTLAGDFAANQTYVDTSSGMPVSATVASSQVGTRVQGAIGTFDGGPPPIQPGESASAIFSLAGDGSNAFLSYASMVLPSNDYYVANGNPTAWDISSVLSGGGPISFTIGAAGTVNDAGTEVNDFLTAAPGGPNLPGLFPGVACPTANPDLTSAQMRMALTQNVANPFANFLNASGVDTTNFNFNDTSLYTNGIATITISSVAVPEPGFSNGPGAIAGCGFLRRRRN